MKKKILFGACAALFLGAGITTAISTTEAVQARSSKLSIGNVETLSDSEPCEKTCKSPNGDYYTIGCKSEPCSVIDDGVRCGNTNIHCAK